MYIPKDVVEQPLYVVTSVFNPVRFKIRWKLYRDFAARIREAGAILVTIEAAFGERQMALEQHAYPGPQEHDGSYKSYGPAPTPPGARMPQSRLNQDYLKVRVGQQQEIWLKENLLNLATQHLPEDARYVAFIDCDVQFVRPDWVSETLHALQHYDVVQMFRCATNLGPAYEPLENNLGFAYCHVEGVPKPGGKGYYYAGKAGFANAWHTGFAWAWRLASLDKVGGQIEHAILGAGDNHMARALVGRAEESLNPGLSEGYKRRVRQWQALALERIKKNIGYIDGTIYHHWHGRVVNRNYSNRWRILIKHHYDPDTDLTRDHRGVIELVDHKPGLRDDIRRYFRARSEDSIDAMPDDHKLIGPKPGFFTA